MSSDPSTVPTHQLQGSEGKFVYVVPSVNLFWQGSTSHKTSNHFLSERTVAFANEMQNVMNM